MKQEIIFIPFLAMMLLTLVVWCYMYYLRLGYLVKNRIDPQKVSTSKAMQATIPEKLGLPSENLVNLFEMPVLFYALILYLYVSSQVDSVYFYLAAGFVFFRLY